MAKSFAVTRHDIGLFKRLWKLSLKKYFPTILIAVVFMLISSGGEAYVLSLLKPLFDVAFMERNYDTLGFVSMQVIGVFFFKSFALYVHSYLMGMVGLRATKEMQNKIFKKFLGMDMSFFARKHFGMLQMHFGADASAPSAFLNSFFTRFMKDIFTIFFMVCLMVYEAPQLSLIILVLLPAIAIPLAKFGKKFRSIYGKSLKKGEEFGTYFLQVLQSIPVVKIYGKEKKEAKRADGFLTELFNLAKKNLKISARVRPTMETLGGIAMGGALLLGGYQITEGILTTGQFVTFLAALFGSYRPLKSISATFVQMQAAMKNTERLFSILDEKSKITDNKSAKILTGKKFDIRFENVSFGYDENKEVLSNVSFEIKSGQTVALVGASGGGKSTIIGLIPRFYDTTNGAIKINNKKISDYTLSSLREKLAFVTQETMLFDGSVEENIAYGTNKKTTTKEIIKAAKNSAAHEFISNFEDGYDEQIGEKGGRLSGGQKQRISIARALLKNAPILLLDEATSALDTKSESVVQEALQTLMKNRTTLVIAHRLSTIINADKIIVIDDGKVIEEGSHDVLLEKKGYYSKLYQMQLKKKDKNVTK